MRFFYDIIIKNIIIRYNLQKNLQKKNIPVFSYGQFMMDNPKATKKERLEAVKKYYNSK